MTRAADTTNALRDRGIPMSFSDAEQGATAASRDDQHADEQTTAAGARRFELHGAATPRVSITASNGPLRVLGEEGETAVTVRAVKPNGETVPLDLVAEVQVRSNGEISIRTRPAGDIERQVRRITKSFEFGRGDIFDNLGDVIDTLASMKTVGNQLDRVRLDVTVPRRCDLVLTTASGAIQAGRVAGNVQVQSASGAISCARIDGKLSVKTASGPQRVGDITGTTSLQTASGPVQTREIAGNLVIQTMSGDAEGQGLRGQLGFKSQSGTLQVRASSLTGFYLNTTSGDCAVEAALAAGEYEVRTVSGDITLRPQPDLSAILSGRTVSGTLRNALPHRHAAEDPRATADDDDDRRESGFDAPEIALPGLRIGKEGIDIGGFLRIDDEALDMPGIHIGFQRDKGDRDRDREQRRERRRGRNRWEFLIGDPTLAAAGTTRLRVRTVSGDLTIRPGRDDAPAASDGPRTTPATPAQATPATDRRGWPDSELWPEATVAPPAPPTAPAPPMPPAPLTPPATSATTHDPAVEREPQRTDSYHAQITQNPGNAATHNAPTAANIAPITAPSSATTDAPDAEQTRLAILEAVRRGEITTDEALLLLRQLDA